MPSKNFHKYIGIADAVAQLSKDRSTRVGAVAVAADGDILAVGYNGFPRGCDDNDPALHERPTKYLWTEHAERNLVYNAARSGVSLKGSTLVISGLHPCPDCARAIIQSGIIRVLCPRWDKDPRWADNCAVAATILTACNVEIVQY